MIILQILLCIYLLVGVLSLIIAILDYSFDRIKLNNGTRVGVICFFLKILFFSPALIGYYKIKGIFVKKQALNIEVVKNA